MRLASPTGLPPRRADRWGMGYFGAPRGSRIHRGLDIESRPAQIIYSPVTGVIIREKRPYGDGGSYDHGVLIEGSHEHVGLTVTIFYVSVPVSLHGEPVIAGDAIGTALSLVQRYPGIMNHVHLEVRQGGTLVDPEPWVYGHDPEPEIDPTT